MSKWDDLKRLAESQPEKEWRFHFQSFSYMTKQKMFSVSGPEGVSDYENWGYTLDAAKYIAAANPAAVLELISEKERLEDRAQYWKRRAKSAEGHFHTSDFESAMKALHKRTLMADTEWDQLDAVERAKLEAAVSVVLGAINEQRASRKPKDDGHE